MLDKQRSRRRDYADYVRKIAEGVEWEEEMDDDLGEDEVDAEHTTVVSFLRAFHACANESG